MSVASELLSLIPAALELVKLLHAGDADRSRRKATAIAQSIALRKLGRATAKAVKR